MQRRLQPRQLPATSPDSAFLCVFNNQSATLKVHDAHTGRVVLSQPFSAVQDRTRRELMPDLTTKIWWTEDGLRLVVRVLMRSRDLRRTSQHIMMLQLGAPEWSLQALANWTDSQAAACLGQYSCVNLTNAGQL